ncbi:MAG: CRTAC1 family protein [Bryobacteraceae bacterium]
MGALFRLAGFLLAVVVFAPLFPTAWTAAPAIFDDITERAGITWRHFGGESADRFLIETSCGGVAFLDFDRDGLLDIYLVNGGETPRGKSPAPVRNALYRNRGNGRFEEVAEKAGVAKAASFGMGATAADYDNDGFTDLYVTGFPASVLYHNNGNGTFSEVTARAGVSDSGEWAASAAWIDFDRDGFLDLFVANYAKLDFARPKPCEYDGRPAYCDQKSYEGTGSRLYRNNRNGTFADVTRTSGISKFTGRAFGAISVDIDGDGWQDLFVACDATQNLLLLNQKNGTFQDFGLDAEVALNSDGMARSGMGVDAGDVNGDGRPDFAVTNFHDELHALYLNTGTFPFAERSLESGVGPLTKPFVGWGVRFLDYDNDGDLDLMIVNGHVTETIERVRKDIRYKERPLLLENDGSGRFRDRKDAAGPVFGAGYAGRGLAVGDIDNDGDLDAAFSCLNDRPVLLRNNAGQNRAWVGLQLQGRRSNRDAIGAKVTLQAGTRRLARWVTSGGSFLASHDSRLTVGLGDNPPPVVTVEIVWPSGRRQTVTGLARNRYHPIIEDTTRFDK